ncbi:hypothetical protein Tco_0955266 [Tanacetum coccineum]|uniref:Uncharacterized protein n=1 Tax=Tanacetum coccineum TaxID=301880 RepID=A0ABQ5E6S1_9ASTR
MLRKRRRLRMMVHYAKLSETVLAIISGFSLSCLLTIDPLLFTELEGQNGFLGNLIKRSCLLSILVRIENYKNIHIGADKKCCHNRLNKGRMDFEYLKQVQEELLSMKSGNYMDDGPQELNYVVSIYNALKKKLVEWVKIRPNVFPMRKSLEWQLAGHRPPHRLLSIRHVLRHKNESSKRWKSGAPSETMFISAVAMRSGSMAALHKLKRGIGGND